MRFPTSKQSKSAFLFYASILVLIITWTGSVIAEDNKKDHIKAKDTSINKHNDNHSQETTSPDKKVNLIASIVIANANKFKIPPSLILAVIKTESNFDPNSISPKGAKGLMQLMPNTQRQFGITDPYNPKENIQGGVAYLSALLKKYKSLPLALAAYNAGPGAVDRYKRIPPYSETRTYVKQVLKSYRLYNMKMKESNQDWLNIQLTSAPLTNRISFKLNQSYQALLDQAVGHQKDGDTVAAISGYHRIISLYPRQILPYLKLAELYHFQGNHLKAIHILKTYLANNRKSERSNEVKKRIIEISYAYRYNQENPT